MQGPNFITKISRSVLTKLFVIVIMVGALLIPIEMIKKIISERYSSKQGAINEISEKWGGQQSIAGPILSVPYEEESVDEEGVKTTNINYAHFLPEDLSVNGVMHPDIRYRGIFEVAVYNSELQISAIFNKIKFSELRIDEKKVLWDRAFVSIGIPDLKGLKQNNTITWNKNNYPLNSAIESAPFMESGVSARVPIQRTQDQYSFNMNVNIDGTGQLNFYPLGKITTVQLSSKWKSPSFTGTFLPSERVVNDNGFVAKWKILHLNRNYPQQWIGNNTNVQGSSFGTKLYYPVDEYQKSLRSIKYAVLFILLMFIAFFLTEIINKIRLHPIQYLMIGLAICIFYLLLISISEHVNFGIAYFIASAASIVLVTSYAKGILKSNPSALTVGSLLLFIYIFLYVTLQLEDYALLIGSLAFFVILGVIMYVTRKTDWYALTPTNTNHNDVRGEAVEKD